MGSNIRRIAVILSLLLVLSGGSLTYGAEYRAKNFLVIAPTAKIAQRIAVAAEQLRRQQAKDWLGAELPAWDDLCPIVVKVGDRYEASGRTSFIFRRRRPTSWRMSLQGTEDEILQSVLPHEIMHTVLATYFGRPLPRWADEGVSVMVESKTTQDELHAQLMRTLRRQRELPLKRLFAADRYPGDILLFYAQGFSVANFLIDAGGKQKFVQFLGDGIRRRDWNAVTKYHYGYDDLTKLAKAWRDFSFALDKKSGSRRVAQVRVSE